MLIPNKGKKITIDFIGWVNSRSDKYYKYLFYSHNGTKNVRFRIIDEDLDEHGRGWAHYIFETVA